MKNETVLDSLRSAMSNDGVFTLEGASTTSYSSRYLTLKRAAQYRWKASSLFSRVLFAGDPNKKRVRESMSRLISYDSETVYVNAYEMFRIPEDSRTTSSLQEFQTFFESYISVLELDVFSYVVINSKRYQPDRLFELDFLEYSQSCEMTRELLRSEFYEVVNSTPLVVNWLQMISGDLTKYIGSNSWSFLPPESVIGKRQEMKLIDKQYPGFFDE